MITVDIIWTVAAFAAICVFMLSLGICHVIGYYYQQKRKLIVDILNGSVKLIESINAKKNKE